MCLWQCLYITGFLSGHTVFLTTAVVSKIDTLSCWKFDLQPLLNSLVCENHLLNTILLLCLLIPPFSFRSTQSLSCLDPTLAVWFLCLSPVLDPKDSLIWSAFFGGQSGSCLSVSVEDTMSLEGSATAAHPKNSEKKAVLGPGHQGLLCRNLNPVLDLTTSACKDQCHLRN